MPKKPDDRAHKTAEKRARGDRRRLAREETVREEHTRLVAERAHDPRFTQRIRQNDGTTVYQWPTDSPQDKHLREAMQRQAERFREKFGRDPDPRIRSSSTPTLTNPVHSTWTQRLVRWPKNYDMRVSRRESPPHSSRRGASWATWLPRTPGISSLPATSLCGTRQSAVTRATSNKMTTSTATRCPMRGRSGEEAPMAVRVMVTGSQRQSHGCRGTVAETRQPGGP